MFSHKELLKALDVAKSMTIEVATMIHDVKVLGDDHGHVHFDMIESVVEKRCPKSVDPALNDAFTRILESKIVVSIHMEEPVVVAGANDASLGEETSVIGW